MAKPTPPGETALSIPPFLHAGALLGLAAGVAFAAAMLATDCHGIRSLLAAEQNPRSMTLLFTLVSAVSFIPVSIAAALGLPPAHGAGRTRPSAGAAAAWSYATARAGRTARYDSERRGRRRR